MLRDAGIVRELKKRLGLPDRYRGPARRLIRSVQSKRTDQPHDLLLEGDGRHPGSSTAQPLHDTTSLRLRQSKVCRLESRTPRVACKAVWRLIYCWASGWAMCPACSGLPGASSLCLFSLSSASVNIWRKGPAS